MPFNFAEQPNFGSGLAQGATNALENIQQNKLGLQLLNAKIAGERANTAASQQNESTLQEQAAVATQKRDTVAPEEMNAIQGQMNGIMSAIQQHKPVPPLDASQVTSQPGQQMLVKQWGDLAQGLSQQARYDKPTVHMITDPITGQQTYVGVDPITGQETWRANGGTGAAAAKAQTSGRATYFKMMNMADSKEKEITQFANSSTPVQAAMQAGTLTLQQLLSSNPDVKATLDQLPFTGMAMDKTYLGGLPRSQQLQGAGSNYLFNLNDTVSPIGSAHPGSFNIKMQNARRLGYQAAQDGYATTGTLIAPDIIDPDIIAKNRVNNAPGSTGQGLDLAGKYNALKAQENAPAPTAAQGK